LQNKLSVNTCSQQYVADWFHGCYLTLYYCHSHARGGLKPAANLTRALLQATMHAALSAHMKRATEDAHKPLPASIRWFGKLCVAYGSALVALLVSRAIPRKPCRS